LFEAAGRDAGWTAAAMSDFARNRRLELPAAVLENLQARYSAFSGSDEETKAAIASVHRLTGRIIDPHTAVGMAAALKMGRPASPVVILSTAHPAKFPDAVAQAIGVPPPEPAVLSGLRKLPERVETLANSPSLIKNFIFSRLIS
jgi:threonine synthase